MKKIIACLCALSLALSLCVFSPAFGDFARDTSEITPLDGYVVKTAKQTKDYKFVNYIQEKDGAQTQSLFYGEVNVKDPKYKLISYDIPTRSGGYSTNTVMEFAQDYEKKTQNKVLMAVNGSFFAISGALKPWFSFTRGKELIQAGSHVYESVPDNGVGWSSDGAVINGGITENAMAIKLGDDEFYEVRKLNSIPASRDIAVYTQGSFKVKENFVAYKVPIVNQVDRLFTDGNTFNAKYGAKPVKVSSPQITVAEGEFYILIAKDCELDKALTEYVGACSFVPTAGGNFANIDYYVGANHTLVRDGAPVEVYPGSSHETQKAPRTTLGFKQDGTVYLSVIDGRQSGYSAGLTVMAQGEMAMNLNAFNAVELDGGGSSIFIMRERDELKVINKPSEFDNGDYGRSVINAVMLVKINGSVPDMDTHATNGEVTINFDECTNASSLTVSDFSATATINGTEKALNLTEYSFNGAQNSASLKFDKFEKTDIKQNIVIKVMLKGGESAAEPFSVENKEPTPPPAIEESTSNGCKSEVNNSVYNGIILVFIMGLSVLIIRKKRSY